MVHGNACGMRIAALLAACALAWPGAGAAADPATESLRALAAEARTTVAQRIEPPIARLPFLCTVRRTQGSPIREAVLREQARAIDAIAGVAPASPDGRRARRMLQALQRFGTSSDAEAWLRERFPGAGGLRLAASLGELPAALNERIHPDCPGVATHAGSIGRTGLPLGRLARSDYESIVREDPADPWNALVLAWVSGLQGEAALRRALAAAQASRAPDADRVALFAWQQWAWLHQQRGRPAEAQAAAREAVRLAGAAREVAGADATRAAQAGIDEAYTRVAMARVLHDAGAPAPAFELLQATLPALRRLAQARPDDLPVQIALMDALTHMQGLSRRTGGPGGPEPGFFREAFALHSALQARTPYTPMRNPGTVSGELTMAVGFAAILTLAGGWALLWRYRRRIERLMRLAASARKDGTEFAPGGVPAIAQQPRGATRTIAAARRAQRHAAAVQVLAGLAFGLLACMLLLRADDLEANPNRVLMTTWTWAWPTVLALGFIWDGDRRRKRLVWLAYFAGVLLLCTRIALGDTPPLQVGGVVLPPFFQGLVYWASSLGLTPLLLLFLNRTLRSIGPVLLALTLAATAGGMLLLTAASTPAGARAAVAALAALHVPVDWMLPALLLAGMLAFVPVAWAVGRLLRAAYAAHWTSDQALMIDTVWLFQAVLLALSLHWSMGAAAAGLGLAAFALHKAITLLGMAPVARAARRAAPMRLLLLRVFTRRDAQGRRASRRDPAEELFHLLHARWRYAGPIRLIGAPDLASTTLNPHVFLDFLAGRLRRRFLVEPRDLPAHLAALDERSDLDACWRVNELFCGNDAWRPAVLALMARSDLVAMDLRDFRPDNDGCIFELNALVDLVPASRIALLVDGSTDRPFLEATIAARLGGRGDARAVGQMAFVDMAAGGLRGAVDTLMGLGAQESRATAPDGPSAGSVITLAAEPARHVNHSFAAAVTGGPPGGPGGTKTTFDKS